MNMNKGRPLKVINIRVQIVNTDKFIDEKSLSFICLLIILLSAYYFPGSVLGKTKMDDPQMRPKNINTNNRLDVIFL